MSTFSTSLRLYIDSYNPLTKYCAYIDHDPRVCFESVSINVLYTFFDWILNQTQGKDGRKRRGTTKRSSLGTYWKVYRLVYERAMTRKLDAKLNRQMHRVLIAPKDLCGEHADIDRPSEG